MQLSSADLESVCSLVLELCGVCLDETKGYLVESRLSRLGKEAGCDSYGQLIARVRGGDRVLRNAVIDAITTHETLFFRDQRPFEALKHKAIPEMIDSKANSLFPKRLRIWCAAASTGQEAYSLAITLADLLEDLSSWDINILATDISDAAIATASLGEYSSFEVGRGLSPLHQSRYFHNNGDCWKVRDEIRSLIRFQQQNLLQPFTGLGPFDIVLCRNVAIYFSQEDRRKLFERIQGVLSPEGYLFVGGSESLMDLGPAFQPEHHCQSVFYRPNLKQANN